MLPSKKMVVVISLSFLFLTASGNKRAVDYYSIGQFHGNPFFSHLNVLVVGEKTQKKRHELFLSNLNMTCGSMV